MFARWGLGAWEPGEASKEVNGGGRGYRGRRVRNRVGFEKVWFCWDGGEVVVGWWGPWREWGRDI